jgi:Na+(H+)/acetate symporter ActP
MFHYSERAVSLMQTNGDPQHESRDPQRESLATGRSSIQAARRIVPIFEILAAAMHGTAALPHMDERSSHSKMQSIDDLSAGESAYEVRHFL